MPRHRGATARQPALPSDFARRVQRWQRTHGRHDLPWQGTHDPYRIWLSEVMLQQTQVTTVVAYYQRFLEHFPDVQALADAPLDDVLGAWSGLGYYSRARNLHRCAQVVVTAHGGRFPADSATLQGLPGIGRSTAAAIAAFGHGERAAILDGNVKRVLSRALGFEGDLGSATETRRLWDLAERLLPPDDVAVYTQGLMDLGATVCLTRTPRCAACPLADDCVASRSGRPQDFPVKTRRLRRSRRHHAVLWLTWRDQVWLVRRPDRGVWAGLWSLPEFDSLEALQQALAGWPGSGSAQPAIEHTLTHFDWRLDPLLWQLPHRLSAARRDGLVASLASTAGEVRWVGPAGLAALGLPAPIRRLLQPAPVNR